MSSKIPRIEWTTATLVKAGNRPSENEDAAATSEDGLRFAVSDGATEGWDSGPWATQLVQSYLESPANESNFPAWLEKVQTEWKPPERSAAALWYLDEKRTEGSFATLIGLELRRSKTKPGWMWRTIAVGDSCLFLIRAGTIKVAFPLSEKEEFDNRPSLIPSSPMLNCPDPNIQMGWAAPGDFLLLATDTVAANLLSLRDPDTSAPLSEAVRSSLRTGDKAPLVELLLSFQAVKNDDMTLTAISLSEILEFS